MITYFCFVFVVFVFVSTCPKHKQVFENFQAPFLPCFSQRSGKTTGITERKPNKILFRFWFFHTCIFEEIFYTNRTEAILTNLLYILQYSLPCTCIFAKKCHRSKNPGIYPGSTSLFRVAKTYAHRSCHHRSAVLIIRLFRPNSHLRR